MNTKFDNFISEMMGSRLFLSNFQSPILGVLSPVSPGISVEALRSLNFPKSRETQETKPEKRVRPE